MLRSIKSGEAKGYEQTKGAVKPKSDAEIRCEQLEKLLASEKEDNAALKKKIEELELKVASLEGTWSVCLLVS